jgi:hypothetical protein
MVHVTEYKICKACDERKPTVDFYKTIKDVCKECRDEYTREERQRLREMEELANRKRDEKIKELSRITRKQTKTIEDMEETIADMQEKLGELSVLEVRMKGAVLAKKLRAK